MDGSPIGAVHPPLRGWKLAKNSTDPTQPIEHGQAAAQASKDIDAMMSMSLGAIVLISSCDV